MSYCIPCAIYAWWRHNDLNGALEGLPAYSETEGHPIIERLCERHRYRFTHLPFLLQEGRGDGTPKTYPNGVSQLHVFKNIPRPYDSPYEYGACSREDLRRLLEHMERGLRMLELDVDYGVLEDFGILHISEQPTVSLDEVIARAEMHRAIKQFLKDERRDPDEYDDEPTADELLQIDSDSDRGSGEE